MSKYKIIHPETNEELEFENYGEIAEFLEIPTYILTNFKSKSNKNIQETFNHFCRDIFITIIHPKTKEEINFKSKKEICEYFNFQRTIFSRNTKRFNGDAQLAVDHLFNYYENCICLKINGKSRYFKNENQVFKYLNLDSLDEFKSIEKKLGSKQKAFDYFLDLKSKNEITIRHPKNKRRKSFSNIGELALFLNKNEECIKEFLDKGFTFQEIVDKLYPDRLTFKDKDGNLIKFDSLNDLVKYLEISDVGFDYQVKKLGSIQLAFDYLSSKEEYKYEIIHPETKEKLKFRTVVEISEYLKIPRVNFEKYSSKNGGIQKTFEFYINKKNEKYKIIDPDTGEVMEFNKVRDISNYLGVKYTRFSAYKAKKGAQEAYNFYKANKITIFGKTYLKNNPIEIYNNIENLDILEYRIFADRFRNFIEIMLAEDIITQIMMENNYICIDFEDGKFKHISEFAIEKGLSEEYVKQKLNEGFTYKDF